MKMLMFSVFCGLLLAGCGEDPIPKPRGYFRIELPEHAYVVYRGDAPCSFEYSAHAQIEACPGSVKDSVWFNILYPAYNARIHVSYKPGDKKSVALYMEDSRNLAYKHAIKADAINEQVYADSARSLYGLMYEIEGNAASGLQFFLTDSNRHFLRGALYFFNPPNRDSIAPVFDWIHEDIVHLVESFSWK